MDQEMEADEFFPDKVMSESGVTDVGNDMSAAEDDVVKQGDGGDSVVNGEEGAEEMETDEPPSVQGEDMETAEEPENCLEDTVRENEAEVNTGEEISGQTENDTPGSSTDLAKENSEYVEDTQKQDLDNTDMTGDENDFGSNLDLEGEISNEDVKTITENEEINENNDNDNVLDLEEPLGETQETENTSEKSDIVTQEERPTEKDKEFIENIEAGTDLNDFGKVSHDNYIEGGQQHTGFGNKDTVESADDKPTETSVEYEEAVEDDSEKTTETTEKISIEETVNEDELLSMEDTVEEKEQIEERVEQDGDQEKEESINLEQMQDVASLDDLEHSEDAQNEASFFEDGKQSMTETEVVPEDAEKETDQTTVECENQDSNEFDSVKDFGEVKDATETEITQMQQKILDTDTDLNEESKEVNKDEVSSVVDLATEIVATENSQNTEDSFIDDKKKDSEELDATEDNITEQAIEVKNDETAAESTIKVTDEKDESNDFKIEEDESNEGLEQTTPDKEEKMETDVIECSEGISEGIRKESEKTEETVTDKLADVTATSVEKKEEDQISETNLEEGEISKPKSESDTSKVPPTEEISESASPTATGEQSSALDLEGSKLENSEAVNRSEVQPSGDNSSQSGTAIPSETTATGDNSNQSEETSGKKSPEFDMSDVKIKKERMDSTESDKTNDIDSSNTGSGQMKIVGVTSAVGVEDKADNSELAKTDDADKKKVENIHDKVSLKQESLAEATATEKEVLKKKVNEELKKKIKQETKLKEDEDDDVIAIKEERKPVQKPKPSKIQTCIVCGKVGKCKYNIVRNGDVKHLCDDNCFKRFRSSPTTYLKQAENSTQNQSKPETQSSSAPATPPVKSTAPVKTTPNQQPSFQTQSQVYKTCTVCQLMNVRTSKPFLNWQGLDFCGEECLGKYQSGLSNNCSYCSGAIFPNNKAKNCCRVGNEVKHFCSANCNNDYIKRMKLCAFCNKDLAQSTDSFMAPVGETFKDFCSQDCLQKFEDKNNKDLEIVGVQKGQKATKVSKGNFVCAVCGKHGPVKHELKLDSKVNRLCSDPCFSAFQYANKLTLNTCDNCATNLNSENQAPQYVQFEGQQRRFCSFMCVNSFRTLNKKTVPCAWCGNKKSNFDMIERVDATNKYQLFCSLNCLSLYRVNLQATSNQAVTCDQCHKFVPAQYHLTMSDASVRNFCSYSCVMQFQAQFQTPAKQVMQHNSVGNSVGVGRGQVPAQQTPQQKLQQQQQQQTTTRSGRIVQKAAKVADTLQAGKGRGMKKDADSFPIISNVVSLAPQGTQHGQQQINIKSSTPVTVTNQQQGIKATTTTTTGSSGAQTVQQQIIIQPPPPKTVKNKSMLCKPFTQTKATSCRPHTQTKEVNTDGKIEPDKYLIPVPVPVYCPTPLAMYSVPTPVLVPVPVPIPVPVFIPTTKKNANSILKQIKEIREKIPADPLEAELLMMAEAVAEKDDDSSSSSEEEDSTAPPAKETNTSVAPAAGGELGEDMLQMALRMASEMSDEPVMDLENSLEPVAVNTEPPPPPKPVVMTPQPVEEEEEEYIPSSARSRRSRGGNKRQSRGTPRRNPKRQKVEVTPQYREATPSPPAPSAPPPDANFHLKYTYGVNAFKHWVLQKNSQIEQASKPGHGKSLRTFKTDILQCTADELNYSLCLFVKEVRKPNGEEYAVDSIYYLCLGIQQYLFENGRIDNIFTDFYYERFTEQLNEILTRYEPKLNHAGQLVCRIEEEHLWESKQLGAHSPHVLLNSLVYFNTKYFMLKTSEDHLKLSFTHIMKHWKKTATGRGSGTGPNAGRSVYLRYYCPTPQGKDNQKKKKEEMPVYEQTENLDNPLRCPVKLYEFYLSKCPETLKSRSDMFYLKPERSSVPDSPVWYSNQPINIEHLTKLLNRIRLVREIQEAHLHTRPIYI